MRITDDLIKKKVEKLRELTGLDLSADRHDDYGGWRLNIFNDGGSGHKSWVFDRSSECDRLRNGEFYQYLDGIITGIKFKNGVYNE